MRISLFAAGLAFGLVETALIASQPIVFQLYEPLTAASAGLIATATSGAAILIDPVVVFVVMFAYGRSIDLSNEAIGAFTSLLTGTLLGTAISFVAVATLMVLFFPVIDIWSAVRNGIFYYGLGSLRLSLVGFAGLALAHFTRPKAMSTSG